MSEEAFKKSAHDLNNLLTGIVNGIELLKNSLDDKAEAERVLANLNRTTGRALNIVQTVLNRKTDDDEIDFIEIDSIVKEVIESFSAEEKSRIKFEAETHPPKIIADSTDIFRIIHNLCKNALEATQEKGDVRIKLAERSIDSSTNLLIEVIDTGSGISSDSIDKIFEQNYSTKTKSVDSGIGLSIVKEKIESLGGKITVGSEGGLTRFSVLIPADYKINAPKINILLAEDDESVSEVLADLLSSQGYNVSLAVTGSETVSMALSKNYNLLIIDKQLPELDGVECIQRIRENKIDTPVVLASGSEVNLDSDDLNGLNIQKVIRKPYKFPEILSAINKFSL